MWILSLVMAYGIFCVLYLALDQLTPDSDVIPIIGALGLGSLVLWSAASMRTLVIGIVNAILDRGRPVGPGFWVGGSILAGLLLRLAWILSFPPVQTSDPAIYLTLAESLLDRNIYEIADTRAYWPPGLSLSLVPTLALFNKAWFAPAINNLVLFAATVVVAYLLALHVADDRVARLTAMLIAIWPNLIFLAGIASKELLVLFLQSSALLFYLMALRVTERSPSTWLFLAGLALGYSVLTQPSTLLFPAVFTALELARRSTLRGAMGRLGLVSLGLILVVSPWTVRNYHVLKAFVPVSTTAGVSLYVGNNPNATGGYVPGVVQELEKFDEVTANRWAAERAREWIWQHPRQFLLLALKKHVLFLGDDSSGSYATLRRGLQIEGPLYLFFKGVSNLFWLTMMVLVLLAMWRQRFRSASQELGFMALSLVFLYPFTLHSIFESGSRHHIAATVPVAILASLVALRQPARSCRASSPRGIRHPIGNCRCRQPQRAVEHLTNAPTVETRTS